MDITKLEQKLDKLDERIDSIDKTLVGQHHSLKEHMRRSDNLEKVVEVLRGELKPVQTHVSQVSGGLKLIGIMSVIVGLVSGIFKLMNF